MDPIFNMLIFAVIAAYCVAKLETNIEGSDGIWAKNLPTYRFNSKIHDFLMGNKTQMTGYHMWLNISFIVLAHFPFFVGFPWSLSMELKILGVFFAAAAMEDFFYYLVNPAYGVRKLTKEYSYWHRFIGPIPMLYIAYFTLAAVLIYLSYKVTF